MKRREFLKLVATCGAVSAGVGIYDWFSRVYAEKGVFPNKPIKFISPFSAGSGNDLDSRSIAPFLEKHLKVSVIIENIPGAEGKIGLGKAWKAPPDGYTIINPGMPAPIILELLYHTEFKVKEFTHIFAWAKENQVLTVHSESWKTLEEFLKDARKRKISLGVTGKGSVAYVNALSFLIGMGIMENVNWVFFGGGGETVTTLAGKHIDSGISTIASASSLIKAQKIRPLMVIGEERDIAFPDMPIPKDLSFDFKIFPVLRGAFGPPKMSIEQIKVLEQAFANAIKEKDFLEWAKRMQKNIVSMGSEACRKSTERQHEWLAKQVELLK